MALTAVEPRAFAQAIAARRDALERARPYDSVCKLPG